MSIKNIGVVLAGVAVLTLCSSFVCIFGKKAGIKGYVYLVKGNQMPSPDLPPAPKKGIATTVYVYELTHIDQVTRSADQSTLYTAVNTKLVKAIQTDAKGYFKAKLPPGEYSLFIKKDNLYYANLSDGNNNIAPVKVEKGKFTELELKADYDAVY
ncbi:MAG: hypothetical protein P0Y53_06350 [Candidatus Pseudobacter hemicellulosilyticus]|uniref:Carboxypeptidase regulatory-like domain-containing protein n=1 Tax=Candidatus Pseudobacter hemicellulosilyticus TaxID=3121375 RepID=A0AAJ6BJ90_9BACT|nr:MAG: hypothetical protein P0Y53_06350 [Pseudobacter sp.]